MATCKSVVGRLVFVCLIVGAVSARAEQARRYREATYGKGELKYIDGLPVLMVAGTPEEIGRQEAALTKDTATAFMDYPKQLLGVFGLQSQWPRFVGLGKSLLPQFPAHHLKELEAFAATAGVDRDELVGVNTIVDTYRGGFGCSSLIAAAERSATGGPLFGRNLDFYSLGRLHKYSLVTVYRPDGKRAFASIGFPGMIGCLSGMNDAGLAVACHEVFLTRDGAPMLDTRGTPYTLCIRRILEECTTVEEAEKLVRSIRRTTLLNLGVCDRKRGAVFEMTPRTVAVRHGVNGICACTNHFRTPALALLPLSRRYSILIRSRSIDRLDISDVARKLHEVNQGQMTLQTMIFEPVPLKLHLAIGDCPSTALPLRKLNLAPLFAADGAGRR